MAVKISRADVVDTHIVEDLPGRFLKVPISRYLETLAEGRYQGFEEALPSQMALINAINKYRFVVAALSRRQGKTFIANIIGQCVTLVPGSNVLIMSPNYQLSSISWDEQHKLLKFHDIETERDNAKDRVVELSNGSTIRMGSINQVDSSVGRSYDLIIFDEAALTDGMEAFSQALRPTLDKPNSKAIFISTPRGKSNWFSVLYNRGYDIGEDGQMQKFPDWCSIHATWADNPRMTEDDVAEARRTMSKALFEQEYEASFNNYEGQIWNLTDDCIVEEGETHEVFLEDDRGNPVTAPDGSFVSEIRLKHPYLRGNDRHKLDIVAGLDLGFKDPTAMCVIGYDYAADIYYVLDEYFDNEKTTSGHAQEIERLIKKWEIDYVFIDSAAQQTKFDLAKDYDIPTINATKSVNDGIGFVASLVDNKKVIVPKHCREVLRAFDAYKWDPNPNLVKEKPKHDIASHMADAIRYALYSFESSVGKM
jgi:hypothetical protein